jgi:RimJ/RimL family protein N-acetyltransferase
VISFGHGVALGPIEPQHLELMRSWRNNYAVFEWCRQFDVISPQAQQAWFEKISADPTIRMYLVWPEKGEKPVGVCGLTSIDTVNRRAEFSLYIAPDCRGNGYGEMALRTLVSHGFSSFGLYNIWGESFDGNPAMSLFLRVGFKKEGTRRAFYFRKGQYIDAHLVSLLGPEWWTDEKFKKAQKAWLPAQQSL